jgi:hypothetical protein
VKIYETIDTLAELQTLNLKKVVTDQIMGTAKDAAYEALLEANGCGQQMVELGSQAAARLPEMQRLRTALAADIETLKQMTTSDTWFVSERTGLLLKQHEMIDESLTSVLGSLDSINSNLERAVTTAEATIAELRPAWIAVHRETWQLEDELRALEGAERAKLEAEHGPPILAQAP